MTQKATKHEHLTAEEIKRLAAISKEKQRRLREEFYARRGEKPPEAAR